MDVMELEFDGCFGLTRVSVKRKPCGTAPLRIHALSGKYPSLCEGGKQPDCGNGKQRRSAKRALVFRRRPLPGREAGYLGRRHCPDGIFVTTEHLAGNDAAMSTDYPLREKKRTAEEKEALLLV